MRLLLIPRFCRPASVGVLLALTTAAAAQPELESLVGRHFVVRFREPNRVHAEAALEEADDLVDRVQDDFGVKLAKRAEIIVCATDTEFDRTVGERQPAWVVGVAQPEVDRIVLKQGSVKGLRRVTRHEAVHLLLGKALGEAESRAPRWLHEGAAKYYGDDWTAADREVLAGAAKQGRLHTIDQLADFPTHPDEGAIAYAESFVLVEYLVSLDPPHGLSRFVVEFRATGEVSRGFVRAYGLTQEQVEAGWREAIKAKTRHAPLSWTAEATGFLLMVVVFVFAYLRVRRRSREIRRRMEEEELLERLFDETRRRERVRPTWPPRDETDEASDE
ncbi:MAG: hypothetical protein FJX75_05075 [Armatimonadetes bacterium]|nr:hypothetical protein [Armatimonadota bacterium]